ncbi:hypothetical protein K0B96_05300 [Horticoccus luteus]|uniref:Uncharacterized protein n=2 Tax=Horticoccus luteus TaxID=2862869 RepID=A0A8F9TXY0_9BACT|nr:hypothetical protein K0B96_05300 [Horticoccus luteus]
MTSLAETGQVTPETLFYDAGSEQWSAIKSNAELQTLLFPEKTKLKLRPQESFSALNTAPAAAAPITVDDMLAAAEGRTAETKDKSDPEIAMARAAKIGMWSAIVILLVSAAGEVLPAVDVIMAFTPAKLLAQPLVLLGLLDALLALLLMLGMVTLYPVVRFRAALGLGFIGFLFWAHGQSLPILLVAAASTGLFCCTLFVSVTAVIVVGLVGLAGAGALTYLLLTT